MAFHACKIVDIEPSDASGTINDEVRNLLNK